MDGCRHTARPACDEAVEGQGLVEYSLILVLISIVSIALVATIGGQVTGLFQTVSGAL